MSISLLDRLRNLLPPPVGDGLVYVLPVLAVVVVLWIVWRVLRRPKRPAAGLTPNLAVDIAALVNEGPPAGPPSLEFYNLPVRLAAIVVAPAGRVRELPPGEQVFGMIDAVVPGLDKVIALHQPLVRRWPSQVSARGFAHAFFNHARLPGAGGKGTPWSSVAGIFKISGQPIMVGFVLRAAGPNNFGQTIVDAEEKWLGCLRVRWN